MKRLVGTGVVVALLGATALTAWDQRATSPAPAAPLVRYMPPRIEVDEHVEVDPVAAAAVIDGIVNDPRGWRTDLDDFTVRFVLPGVGGTDGFGGLIGIAYPDKKLALVTADAWTTVGPKFAAVGGTLTEQRTWIVLHEIGHLLGHPHQECPGRGPAPVMRATSYGLNGCDLNAWPRP